MLFKLAFVSFAASALAHIPLDPVCPKGFYSGVQINDFQFDQPFQKFYERTKSFFDSSWYVSDLSSSLSSTTDTPLRMIHSLITPLGQTTNLGQLVKAHLVMVYSKSCSSPTTAMALLSCSRNTPVWSKLILPYSPTRSSE